MEYMLRRFGTWLRQEPWEAMRAGLEVRKGDILHSDESIQQDTPPELDGGNGDALQSDTSIQQDTPPGTPTPAPSYNPPLELTGRVLQRPNRLADSEPGTVIAAAVFTAAVLGGPTLAGQVANTIGVIGHAIAAVPAAEAGVTAKVVLDAVTEYAGIVTAEPGRSFAAIYEQARNAIPPAAFIPALSEGLAETLGNVDHIVSAVESWERKKVATSLIMAIAIIADEGASEPADCRQAAANIYAGSATWAADRVRDGIASTGPGTPQHPPPIKKGPLCGGTSRGYCEAVLQVVQLQAALSALRGYSEQVGRAQAGAALTAVTASVYPSGPANESPSLICTCDAGAGICQAVVQVRRLRAGLQALLSYSTRAGDDETVHALAAVTDTPVPVLASSPRGYVSKIGC
jgi:hypothetical protein